MTPTWPAAIPEGTGLDPWVREVINNITQGTGPTEDLDFKVARAKYRVKVKATLKAKFLALQATKLAAFKAQRTCFSFLMKVAASQACLTCSKDFANQIKSIDENTTKMSFAPAVATNLRDACYPAVVGLYRLGQDYAFMAKVRFQTEKYKDMKEMFGKVREIMKRFVNSDMKASAIGRLLNDIMDKRQEIEDKGKEIDEDTNKFIRERKVYKLAFRYDAASCTAESCQLLRKWIGRNGFTDMATSMSQFNPTNMSNITTADMPEGDGSAMADEDEWSNEIGGQLEQIMNTEEGGQGRRLLSAFGLNYVLPNYRTLLTAS